MGPATIISKSKPASPTARPKGGPKQRPPRLRRGAESSLWRNKLAKEATKPAKIKNDLTQRDFTTEERMIIERDFEQQVAISSELSSRSSLILAVLSLDAAGLFSLNLVNEIPILAGLLAILLIIGFALVRDVLAGITYSYPARSGKWLDWMTRRQEQLRPILGDGPSSAAAGRELQQTYLRELLAVTEQHTNNNDRRSRAISSAGTVSVVVAFATLLVYLLQAILRVTFS
jgi:hypothetical protein